ncbi:hypothetical protein GBL57_11915 [Streptococcus equi]|nr:hypothetical protein [Streptococcus equi]
MLNIGYYIPISFLNTNNNLFKYIFSSFIKVLYRFLIIVSVIFTIVKTTESLYSIYLLSETNQRTLKHFKN